MKKEIFTYIGFLNNSKEPFLDYNSYLETGGLFKSSSKPTKKDLAYSLFSTIPVKEKFLHLYKLKGDFIHFDISKIDFSKIDIVYLKSYDLEKLKLFFDGNLHLF